MENLCSIKSQSHSNAQSNKENQMQYMKSKYLMSFWKIEATILTDLCIVDQLFFV